MSASAAASLRAAGARFRTTNAPVPSHFRIGPSAFVHCGLERIVDVNNLRREFLRAVPASARVNVPSVATAHTAPSAMVGGRPDAGWPLVRGVSISHRETAAAAAQRAFQLGLRFSAKARGPSTVSSERRIRSASV